MVTAASVKDPTKTATAVITLQPITISALNPATVSLNGGAAPQAFTGATLTYDGSNSGVTWSISPTTANGGGSIVSTSGAYIAPAVVAGTSPVTVTVTATSVKDNTKTATATITLNPISVSLGSTTSATLDAGQSYSGIQASIANDSSNSGITFTVATGGGTFLSSGTSTLTVTGAGPIFSVGYNTPATVASQTTTTITAASVKDPTKTAAFTVTLNPARSWSTPSSSTATLTGANTNTAYSYTLVAAGGTGTKSYTITTGTLPAGLTVNSSIGAITGSPTEGAGSSTFGVHVTDQSSHPSILSGTFTIVVTATPLAWTTPAGVVSLPTATVGMAITPYTLGPE